MPVIMFIAVFWVITPYYIVFIFREGTIWENLMYTGIQMTGLIKNGLLNPLDFNNTNLIELVQDRFQSCL
jgi:hypothetical protein